jgi:catecholate siderophore receptor
LNAENLLNRKYYPTASGDNNSSPGAPRKIQLSVADDVPIRDMQEGTA